MMSSEECRLKSVQCEHCADKSSDPGMRAGWLDLANDWRDLADDGGVQATTARLMDARRA